MFNGDVIIFEPLGFFFGLRQQLRDAIGDVNLVGTAGWARDLGQPVDFLLNARPKGVNPDIRLIKDGWGEPARLIEEGEEEVFGIKLLVAVLDSDRLSGSNGFLEFFGKSVEVHNLSAMLSTNISISP
jgi:hypothetical protein